MAFHVRTPDEGVGCLEIMKDSLMMALENLSGKCWKYVFLFHFDIYRNEKTAETTYLEYKQLQLVAFVRSI